MQNPSVIFEDDYILALNKPAGWVVNDSETSHGNPTLQSWIEENYSFETSHKKELRSGIVHRLDKPTSGIILVAKTEDIFNALQKQFADRETEKVYVALVHGKVEPSEGVINEKVGRLPWMRTKFGVHENGREAVTSYKVIRSVILSEAEGSLYTFVELYPKTGRTHQLRVHLKHIGNPIVGDHLYAGRKISKADLKEFGRLMLHAKSIEFIHPITKKKMLLKTDLPKEFEFFLK
jgi:23S rRNA pseudouridine1911/1915/1917 synthase